MNTATRLRRIRRRIRRTINLAIGRDVHFPVTCHRPVRRHGSDSCGWDILPELVNADSVVYAFGIGKDISFDISLVESYGVRVHSFDPTPESIRWARGQRLPDQIVLHEYGVSDQDAVVSLYPPKKPQNISHTIVQRLDKTESQGASIQAPMKRLTTIMSELNHQELDLLKMDVEGAEYQVIDDLINSQIRIGQLLIEFHHRMYDIPVISTKKSVQSLLDHGFRIFHVTDGGREYSFAHQDFL
jgi:FkbM family methyltransferase